MRFYAIAPTAKPRMTKRDTWAKRPCVLRYRAFKDAVKAAGIQVPVRVELVFHIAMPASWSKAERARMNGRPHQQKPDVDNLRKGMLDAVLTDDSAVWKVMATKRWGVVSQIGVGELDGE